MESKHADRPTQDGQFPPAHYSQPAYGNAPYYSGADDGLGADGLLGSLDPLRVLAVLRKRWIWAVLVFCVMVGMAVLYLVKADPVYRATALMELSVRRPRILNQQAAVIDDQSTSQSEEIFNTRLERFKGATLLGSVVNRLRAARPAGVATDEDFKKMLVENVNFSLLRRTRLIKIEFEDSSPDFAMTACNAFVDAAEASAYDENRIASDAAVIWLETQAVSQRKELDLADGILLKFRQDNKIDILDSRKKTVENALLDFNKVLVEVEGQSARERDLLEALTALDLKPETAGSVPADAPRADEIKLAMEKWLVAIADRDALLAKYTPMHPEVQAKEKMVALFREQATEALMRARATVVSNLKLYDQQAASLDRKKNEQLNMASDLDAKITEGKMRLVALERARDASDAAYRGVLARIQEARMAADENTATVKVVERAQRPEKPVKPRKLQILILAVLLGLGGGVVLALLVDKLEDRMDSPGDVERISGLKVMAVVPHVASRDRNAVATASINHRFSEVAEAFASLRSMLDSPQYRERSKVILVVSSIPGEGKTITSCNLAAAGAKNGQRTLLIDFDLRRSRLAGIFPMPAGPCGLLEILNSEQPDVAVEALGYLAGCDNLTVIASRPVKDASPAELMGGAKVAGMVNWARASFDRVIIDAPPLGLVSDALVLAALVDCVLMMARPDVTHKRLFCHVASRFREAGVGTLAAVVNDVDFSKTTYGAYSPYYHYQKHYKSYINNSGDADDDGR